MKDFGTGGGRGAGFAMVRERCSHLLDQDGVVPTVPKRVK